MTALRKYLNNKFTIANAIVLSFLIIVLTIAYTFIWDSEQHLSRYKIPSEESGLYESLPFEEYNTYNPDADRVRVLIIHSYQKDILWSDNMTRGIKDRLFKETGNIHLSVEYMGSREFPTQMTSENYINVLKSKYSNNPFDVIIACDNNALAFLKQYRDDIFGHTPVVFTGINNYSPILTNGLKHVSGISEWHDANKTLDIALNLNPEIKKVYFISDNTNTGKAVLDETIQRLEIYPKDIEYYFLTDYTTKGLGDKLASLGNDSIAILIIWTIDKEGNIASYFEAASYLVNRSAIPIYGTWGFLMGSGIVGGHLTTGYMQGEAAAEMAIKVLNGVDPDNIPVVNYVKMEDAFDYNALKKFDLDIAKLPKESTIINYPSTFFTEHRIIILIVSAVFMVMTVVIVMLIMNIYLRVNTQIKLAQNQINLKKTVVELASKNEELESIVYASYHDLRSPLVNISGFVHELNESYKEIEVILEDEIIPEKEREEINKITEKMPSNVEFITKNTTIMSKLQKSLLEISKIGQERLNNEVVNMNEIIKEISIEIPEIENGYVDLHFVNLPSCIGDKKKLKTVFKCIIENSIKFQSPARKCSICIGGELTNSHVEYEIADNGIGFDKKNQNMIFQLFYQLEPNKAETGVGLGLTVAKRIISRHGGEITADSTPGEGSTFKISLPIYQQLENLDNSIS